jgi:NAD(P)-dependent dehydrogenase (short-subunit alcohol dehydrogenase family)
MDVTNIKGEMTMTYGAKSTADQVLANLDLNGRRFLVTGAAGGIGLETVRALTARGASVVGTVRDSANAETNIGRVRDAASAVGGSVDVLKLDLASLRSVRAGAETLLAEKRPFDAIIANAGIMAPPLEQTADGFESQFGVNHLGHFALVNMIEPLLADAGRLVVLTSQAHRVSDIDLDDPNFERQAYEPFVGYGRSKTANALFAVEFNRRHRGRGIVAASVMPGNSLTDLARFFSQEELQGLFETVGRARAEAGLPPGELKSVGQAAATTVWAAVAADRDQIGGLYLEDCAVAPVDDTPNPFADGVRSYALDTERARQLWARSEAMIQAA